MKKQFSIIISNARTYSEAYGTMSAVPSKLVRTVDAVKGSKN
jgi:uncharacterized BrkB/YihY/UPF0761 family membrane protein